MDGGGDLVLILTAGVSDAEVLASVVERMGYVPTICRQVQEVCAQLGSRALALLITEESIEQGADTLGNCIARQPPWSDLPVVVLTSRRIHRAGVARQPFFDRLGHVTLLQRPLRLESLTNAVATAVRTRLRQYELRGRLDELASSASRLESQVRERTRTLEQALAQLHEAQRSLMQAQRLEAVGQMTGGIAHDFNNLLQVIVASADMAHRLSDGQARLGKPLDTIRHAAQRGSQLTRQLLAFASRQPLTPRLTDLRRQLPGSRDLLQRSLPNSIVVTVSVEPTLWPVLVDVAQLDVALLNLVVNAGDAIEGSGAVDIVARNQPLRASPQDVPPAAAVLPAGDYVCIEVADTGSGMTDKVAARVFEPFFTTKKPGKGTGLGLSQVFGFARQTGGAAAVRSTSPAGTVIALWLPRAPQAAGAPDAAASPTDAAPAATASALEPLRVLVVEDDPAVAAAVSAMIEAFGHDVRLAATADDALAVDLDTVDIVFSDVIMPGRLDGVELGLRLRALRPGLPVLLTSGYAGAPERVAAASLPLLSKPYTPAQWSAAVAALLAR